MQQLKSILLTLAVAGTAFFMFFVGLGLTLFIFVILAIMRLFMKPKSHEQLKAKWQHHYQSKTTEQPQTATHSNNIIEGQYTVVDKP